MLISFSGTVFQWWRNMFICLYGNHNQGLLPCWASTRLPSGSSPAKPMTQEKVVGVPAKTSAKPRQAKINSSCGRETKQEYVHTRVGRINQLSLNLFCTTFFSFTQWPLQHVQQLLQIKWSQVQHLERRTLFSNAICSNIGEGKRFSICYCKEFNHCKRTRNPNFSPVLAESDIELQFPMWWSKDVYFDGLLMPRAPVSTAWGGGGGCWNFFASQIFIFKIVLEEKGSEQVLYCAITHLFSWGGGGKWGWCLEKMGQIEKPEEAKASIRKHPKMKNRRDWILNLPFIKIF